MGSDKNIISESFRVEYNVYIGFLQSYQLRLKEESERTSDTASLEACLTEAGEELKKVTADNFKLKKEMFIYFVKDHENPVKVEYTITSKEAYEYVFLMDDISSMAGELFKF